VCICILTVIQSVAQVMVAQLSRALIDAAVTDQGSVLTCGLMLAADILLIIGIGSLLSWYSSSSADRINAHLRQSILRTAVYNRDVQMLRHHSGELLNRGMEDVAVICDGMVGALPGIVGQTARLVTAFIAVLLISPTVAGVLLVVAIVVVAATACLRPMLKKRHKAVRISDEKMMATLQEDLQHLELIHSLDMQEQTISRFGKRVKENLYQRFKRRVMSVTAGTVLSLASQIGSGTLLIWGAVQIASGSLTYGSLTAMLQLMSQFRAPVLGLSGLWSRIASVEVASERLAELLTPVRPQKRKPIQSRITAIVFDDVSFTYPGEENPVLDHFSFRIPLGGWSCLTGVSGKGKTTMFKLALGLYEPQSGSIYLETADGKLPCSEQTRQLFAYVPQDYALFSGTVLENMQMVAPELTKEQFRTAICVAQAEFIWDMPQKELTYVQENNAGLSKGQLQRLAIARAILMDRPIFLLDECTSALDAWTEDAVLRGLKSLGKQAVLVTHRPEALKSLDGITKVSMEK
jgi:ATP-binding cassette subfamily B protein